MSNDPLHDDSFTIPFVMIIIIMCILFAIMYVDLDPTIKSIDAKTFPF